MTRYICIHGHFYQPPRENPWLEEVEVQDSAYPFHDWNERITAECYGPNATARILDSEQRIVEIVNNYSRISFNFGPTLLSWLEKKQPEVYDTIIQADALSLERFGGHGSAMAQAYNHIIMPLANERDRRTQVLWGIEDFARRFGRDPEGMWLAETAVDTATLEELALNGIRFTVLAPRQAARVRRLEDENGWYDVSDGRVDPTAAYRCELPSGRSISLFFYDGPISQDLAFGGMLASGEVFKERLAAAFTENGRDWPQLVHVATDGETYGHHHTHGEMALAYCLYLIEQDPSVELTNYSAYLAAHQPVMAVEIFDNSSWSCIHGVERWRSDCGCNSGGHGDWNQAWRAPLRQAMDWLSEQAAAIFSEQGPKYFKDPWGARDRYIRILLNRSENGAMVFLDQEALEPLGPLDRIAALKLLELQRFAQYIYTSCGWFFDEISGIETVQNMQYAARAIQLAEELCGCFLEERFAELLEQAPSNLFANGAEVYDAYARPARVNMLRVAAHYAISSLFNNDHTEYHFGSYLVLRDLSVRYAAGRSRLVLGKAKVASKITGEHILVQYAVLHPGDHNVICGLNFYIDRQHFSSMETKLRASFERGELAEAIRTLDSIFGENIFSIQHLFRDDQRKVVDKVLASALDSAESSYREMFESNYPILNFLDHLNIPVPEQLRRAAGYVVSTDLKRLFDSPEMNLERLRRLMAEAGKWSLDLHQEELGYLAANWVNERMQAVKSMPGDLPAVRQLSAALEHLVELQLGLHHWKAQNLCFALSKEYYPEMQDAAEKGDVNAAAWTEHFRLLAALLQVALE